MAGRLGAIVSIASLIAPGLACASPAPGTSPPARPAYVFRAIDAQFTPADCAAKHGVIVAAGGRSTCRFKIAENNSPLPRDR